MQSLIIKTIFNNALCHFQSSIKVTNALSAEGLGRIPEPFYLHDKENLVEYDLATRTALDNDETTWKTCSVTQRSNF